VPKVLRDAGWLATGYLGRSFAYLAVALLLARVLGPTDYGRLSVFIAVSMTISYLAGSWPFLAVPVLVARGDRVSTVVTPAGLLACIVVIPAATVVVLTTAGVDDLSFELVLPYALALMVLQAVYAVLQAAGAMRRIAAIQTGERVVALAVALVLAATGGLDLTGGQAAVGAGALVASVVSLTALARRTPLLSASSANRDGLRRVLSAVGSLGIVTLAAYGVAWIDLLILAALESDAVVGTYAVAYQIFTVVLQLGALWVVAALPHHARQGKSVQQSLEATTVTSAALVWSAGVVVVGLLGAVGLPRLFGASFRDAVTPLLLLLTTAPLLALYFPAVPVLIASDRTRRLAAVSVGGVVVNVALDLVLIPPYGILGPALATAAQNALVAVALGSLILGRNLTTAVAWLLPALASLTALAAWPESFAARAATAIVALVSLTVGLRGLSSFLPSRASVVGPGIT